jgi:uncharacterized membrane protein YtjA (UPF0391 family)
MFLRWIIILLVIALLAMAFGYKGVASVSLGLANFLISLLVIVLLVLGALVLMGIGAW